MVKERSEELDNANFVFVEPKKIKKQIVAYPTSPICPEPLAQIDREHRPPPQNRSISNVKSASLQNLACIKNQDIREEYSSSTEE